MKNLQKMKSKYVLFYLNSKYMIKKYSTNCENNFLQSD